MHGFVHSNNRMNHTFKFLHKSMKSWSLMFQGIKGFLEIIIHEIWKQEHDYIKTA